MQNESYRLPNMVCTRARPKGKAIVAARVAAAQGAMRRRASSSLDEKFIVVGWKKTGTTSVTLAFHLLGIGPQCMCTSVDQLEHFAVTSDSSFCCSSELADAASRRYQGAKFVLTTRNPTKWNESVVRWLDLPEKSHLRPSYQKLMGGARVGSREFIDGYTQHNARVRALFTDQPERLLELDLAEEDPVQAMRKLCAFTGRFADPACADGKAFPHTNVNCEDADDGQGEDSLEGEGGNTVCFGAPNSTKETLIDRHLPVSSARPPHPRPPPPSPTPSLSHHLPFTLKLQLDLRQPSCPERALAEMVALTHGIGYLAVARTGSEAMQLALEWGANLTHRTLPHNHDCRLRDFERLGAPHVMIGLRHPVDRIMSGVQRRSEGNLRDKQDHKVANQVFVLAFRGRNASND